MAVTDFLGNVGNALMQTQGPVLNTRLPMPGPISGFGGGTFDLEGRQVTPVDRYLGTPTQQQAQAPQQPAMPAKKRGGVRDFLGKLGDALLVGNGGEPIYAKKLQQERMGDLLAQYLGMDDPALANLMREDYETGLEIWKARQPKAQSPTALQQNIEYLRRLTLFDNATIGHEHDAR